MCCVGCRAGAYGEQVLEVQEALDAQKEEFERREELFKQREEQARAGRGKR